MLNPNGEVIKDNLMIKVRKQMQEATSTGDYKVVQRLARIAEELDALQKKEEQIAESRAILEAILEQPLESINPEEISPRERGNRVRNHYVEGVLPSQGIQLKRVTTKKYLTADGLLVGITYAKELEIRPSSWFLSISDEHFDCVILLCESSDKTGAEIATLLLPAEFVEQIWKDLSRSQGQVKFHIARNGYSNFALRAPGREPVNISPYLNAVQALNKLDGGTRSAE